jgi:mono/diheme cytochrome c family protein
LSLLGACERRPEARADFEPGPVPAELTEGERLFERNCARCHGSRAAGTEQGPPLVHIVYEPNHHADIAFQRAVAFGVAAHHWRFGDMPPVPGVDEAAVAQITAYVRWLQRRAGIE